MNIHDLSQPHPENAEISALMALDSYRDPAHPMFEVTRGAVDRHFRERYPSSPGVGHGRTVSALVWDTSADK